MVAHCLRSGGEAVLRAQDRVIATEVQERPIQLVDLAVALAFF